MAHTPGESRIASIGGEKRKLLGKKPSKDPIFSEEEVGNCSSWETKEGIKQGAKGLVS